MGKKSKYEKKNKAAAAMCEGFSVSLITTLLITTIAAVLISREVITESSGIYFVPLTHAVSAYLGCYISCRKASSKELAVVCGTAAIYYLLLIGAATFIFDGSFTGVLLGLLMTLLGALAAFLSAARIKNSIHRKRLHAHAR